ncbi:hypothetical protein C5C45_01275 [Rathayibacter rathayi]|uniref:Uncharacterized protein n=1 Tax=Rathayibacter rathayi TaxID=33887 RepID=A0ABX5AF42_RATRA|nr:hypothetical protein C5C08_06380 [Rathayibacter rathayi]PPH37792.1 hypothetical protein C5C28_03560 [Rathayibacter rathayi]PPH70773.1 hypothetical protein C5C45_01275 [Rathayibacter rathayi]PPH78096.1 hypothetical protein C5C40_05960 [Rathayibacter rathayi]
MHEVDLNDAADGTHPHDRPRPATPGRQHPRDAVGLVRGAGGQELGQRAGACALDRRPALQESQSGPVDLVDARQRRTDVTKEALGLLGSEGVRRVLQLHDNVIADLGHGDGRVELRRARRDRHARSFVLAQHEPVEVSRSMNDHDARRRSVAQLRSRGHQVGDIRPRVQGGDDLRLQVSVASDGEQRRRDVTAHDRIVGGRACHRRRDEQLRRSAQPLNAGRNRPDRQLEDAPLERAGTHGIG